MKQKNEEQKKLNTNKIKTLKLQLNLRQATKKHLRMANIGLSHILNEKGAKKLYIK